MSKFKLPFNKAEKNSKLTIKRLKKKKGKRKASLKYKKEHPPPPHFKRCNVK